MQKDLEQVLRRAPAAQHGLVEIAAQYGLHVFLELGDKIKTFLPEEQP
jgi:hypothetical protein